jgi:hypothetical protein
MSAAKKFLVLLRRRVVGVDDLLSLEPHLAYTRAGRVLRASTQKFPAAEGSTSFVRKGRQGVEHIEEESPMDKRPLRGAALCMSVDPDR